MIIDEINSEINFHATTGITFFEYKKILSIQHGWTVEASSYGDSIDSDLGIVDYKSET